MNNTKILCPACSSTETTLIIKSKKFPAILFPIEKEKRFNVASAPLNATYCNSCEHIFLTDIDRDFNSKIYSEYYYLYPFSELEFMMEAYRKPFEKIFNYFSHHEAPKKNLLEIGCSSEQQLDIFISKGYECTGISPGAESSENINLIDGFYESVKFESNFDYIVSRFNLEHIIDLNKFLKKVYKELRDDGLFFVQVPNVLSFLKNGIVSIFAHEHPQYFCRSSISKALEHAGFEIEMIQAAESDSSIIVVARKRLLSPSISKLIKNNLGISNKILEIIQKENRAQYVFYGAGLTLTGLLYIDNRICSAKKTISVIDDNPAIIGKYMPGTNFKILSPDSISDEKNKILFVFLSSIYHENLLPRIKNRKFMKIYYINEHGLCEYVK